MKADECFVGSRRLMIYRRLPEGETSDVTLGRSKTDGEGVSADDLNAFRVKVCTLLQNCHYYTHLTIHCSTTIETPLEQRRKKKQRNDDDPFKPVVDGRMEPETRSPIDCHPMYNAEKIEWPTTCGTPFSQKKQKRRSGRHKLALSSQFALLRCMVENYTFFFLNPLDLKVQLNPHSTG